MGLQDQGQIMNEDVRVKPFANPKLNPGLLILKINIPKFKRPNYHKKQNDHMYEL